MDEETQQADLSATELLRTAAGFALAYATSVDGHRVAPDPAAVAALTAFGST